ncbi:Hypothetical predicted protein [Paramuricea clavata]|uniref:Uncharacterized protein n=1 Tax=Paramuricea clavata TaxID=317549 RepID=A0A7D9HSR1_PARCT|nr:Hypothetical predicted protein [Paramuricea clavata]
MESSQSTKSFKSSDDDGCDVYHDVEQEQAIQNLSVSIAGLKRVLCDANTQDEDIVIIPEKKSLKQLVLRILDNLQFQPNHLPARNPDAEVIQEIINLPQTHTLTALNEENNLMKKNYEAAETLAQFASLAYVQWQCLVKSYKLFTAALKNVSPAFSDELHPLQYQVLGQDFVDLLLMHNMFAPVANVM